MWQALRRVWRLGQTRPVMADYAIYRGVMEAIALALMGQKMKAAQLLYGDEVGGAIVEEDEGDSLMMLAREALNAAELPDLQTLFADNSTTSSSPMGSMTMPSEQLPIPVAPGEVFAANSMSLFAWLEANKDAPAGVSPARSSRAGKGKKDPNQMSLF